MGDETRLFVVQHHLATADHYDFRLEVDGVLVSWAVPKGPSTDPQVRRFARRVDDHDLEHARFEGATGSRRDGRGAVQIWDSGTFRNTSHDGPTGLSAAQGLGRGQLSFELDGAKLHGGWTLLHTHDADWLLIKKRGAGAHEVPDDRSVVTGRTLDEIIAAGRRQVASD